MKKKKVFYYFLLFIFTIPAVLSFLKPGFFPSHDGEWMIIRLSDFHRSLVSGIFPVRWAARLNHQFGYPVFNFLYPLSLYFGEVFHLIGFDFVWSIKLVFVFSFFFSGLFMFLWLKEKWGRLPALLAALIYIYTPYRFVDVYVRGSLGEALAFVWPPLIFWAIEKGSDKKNWRLIAIASLSLACLITSHNTLALLFVILMIFYLIFIYFQKKSFFIFHFSFFILALGLGLSTFFWLPALYDKQFVIFDQVLVSNFFTHFPSLRQLILPSWGYGPSLPLSTEDKMSFQVGPLNLIIGLISLGIWLRNRQKEKSKIGFFVIAFWLTFLLMLPISSWAWQILPVSNLIQFPWRLLSLTTFIAPVLAGFLMSKIRAKWQIVFVLLSAIFLIYQAKNYAQPEYFLDRPLSFYFTNEATTNVKDEYTPIWVKERPQKRAEKRVAIIQGTGEIKNLNLNSKKISFQADLEEESRIQLNIHYFPGWKLFINSKKEAIDYKKSGLIEFSLPQGNHEILTSFDETPVRFLADFISLTSLGVIIFCIIKSKEVKDAN